MYCSQKATPALILECYEDFQLILETLNKTVVSKLILLFETYIGSGEVPGRGITFWTY
jgi:hypothetical protein